MKTYNLDTACLKEVHSFFGKSRICFEGLTDSKSIRAHNAFTSFFLKFFTKIIDVKDIDGKIYHLNRASTQNWLKENHARQDIQNATQNTLFHLPAHTIVDWINEVLERESPKYIVKISKIKIKLKHKKDQLIRADKHHWNSPAHKQLPEEIRKLKERLENWEDIRKNAS